MLQIVFLLLKWFFMYKMNTDFVLVKESSGGKRKIT